MHSHTHYLFQFLLLLTHLLLWGNMTGMHCTFCLQSPLPLWLPDRPALPQNPFAKAPIFLEEASEQEKGVALPTSAWDFCFLGSTVASVTASSCPGAFWVLDHRHTASPRSNSGCYFTDGDLEVKGTFSLGSLQELPWRASAFPVLGQQSYPSRP